MQCQKKLWFDFHDPIIEKKNLQIYQGNKFGETVRKYYGEAADLTNKNTDLALSETAKIINDEKIKVIYEAAFLYSDTFINADVLLRKNNGWELLEAKSSLQHKEEYNEDIAIQSYIIKSSGIKLSSVKLIYLDDEFTYMGDGNYNGLIKEKELTEEILDKEKLVQSNIDKLKLIADKNFLNPKIEMGEHCNKPHPCIYIERCKNLLPKLPKSNKTPISILPYKGSELEKEYKEKNIHYLEDIPARELKKDSYRIIQDCHKNNKTWVSDEISDNLKKYDFPFYFMDFETIQQVVPIIKGTHAYYQLPFQWSVHKWNSLDEEIDDKSGKFFIDFDNQNIERNFIESLLEATGDKGTVFAHSASSEKAALKRISEKENFKDLSIKINKLILRVVDTLGIVKKNFYSPLFMGKYGLKIIVKAIPGFVNYEEEGNISSGTEAGIAWYICADKKTTKEEKEKQIKLLKEYCAKDTLALYYLIKYLIKK